MAAFQNLLPVLAEALGLDDLPTEEDGRVLFGLDDSLGVVMEEVDAEEAGAEGMVASILIGMPDRNDAALLSEILAGNYMWAASGEGTLALDRESGMLVVHRFFAADTPGDDFLDIFASMVSAARYWRSFLEGTSASSGEASSYPGMLSV